MLLSAWISCLGLVALELANAQVIMVTTTYTRRPSTCSNPQQPPFTVTITVGPSAWSSMTTYSIMNGATGLGIGGQNSSSSMLSSLSSPNAENVVTGSPIAMSQPLSQNSAITPSATLESAVSTTIEISSVIVQPTPIDTFVASGEPFNLIFDVPFFKAKQKRQGSSSSVRIYVMANGNTTTDQSKAVNYRLLAGELWANNSKISTNPAVFSQPFAPISPMGLITTNFSTYLGKMSWNSSLFETGTAQFFRVPEDQVENAQIIVKFRGVPDTNWTALNVQAAPARLFPPTSQATSVLVQTSTLGLSIVASQVNAGGSMPSMVPTAVHSVPGSIMTPAVSTSTANSASPIDGPMQGSSNIFMGTNTMLPSIASSSLNAFSSSNMALIYTSASLIPSVPVFPSLVPSLSLPPLSVISLPSSPLNSLHASYSAGLSISFAVSAALSLAPQPNSVMSGSEAMSTIIPPIAPINPSQILPGYSSSNWISASWAHGGSMSAWSSATSSPWPPTSTPEQISPSQMSSAATTTSSNPWHVVSSISPATSSQTSSSMVPQPSGIIYSAGAFSFIGCYNETMQNGQPYTFNGVRYSNSTTMTSMTVTMCASLCADYTYFGVEYGVECYCSNQITPGAGPTSNSDCNMVCPGAHATFCGGSWRLVAYSKAQQAASSILPLPSVMSAMSSQVPGVMTSWISSTANSMPMSSAGVWSTMASSMVGTLAFSTVISVQASSAPSMPTSSIMASGSSAPTATCPLSNPHIPSPTVILGCLTNDDDDDFGAINLPWEMRLYNTSTESVFASTNGFLTLLQGSSQYQVAPLPTTNIPPVAALPYFDDLSITGGTDEGIWYYADNMTLMVEWRVRASFDVADQQIADFTLMYARDEPGVVWFEYYTLFDGGDSASIGVQGAQSGPNFIQFSYQNHTIAVGDLIRCDTNAGVCAKAT